MESFQRENQSVIADELLKALADGQDINLIRCNISGVLDVNRLLEPAGKFPAEQLNASDEGNCKILTFSQQIAFDKCTFEENVIFTSPWDKPGCLSVAFKSDIIFNSSKFKAQVRFRNARFGAEVGFDGCTFEGFTTFKGARFCKDAKFRTVVFDSYCLFSEAVFESAARFTNSHFVKGVNFSGVRFISQIDFNGVYSSSRSVPACDGITFELNKSGESESFWRFAKQSAQEAGYYHLAGEYFYNERCAGLRQKVRGTDYDNLPSARKFVRWILAIRLLPELIFGRMLFGYGERPVRVLLAGAMIIILCAFFYAQPDALIRRSVETQHSFMEGLYFSTITFTTLGYGDLYPSAAGFYRQLAMFEAITGALLMALFIVCLAKRFSRG